jgi:hypothetical protein
LFIYWFWLVLLIGEIFKFTASLIIPFAFVAILFKTMEDVLLTQAIASEAGYE